MREEKAGHISSALESDRSGCGVREDVLAADRPAFTAAGGLQLRRPPALALLRGSAARRPPAEDRRPAGEALGGRRGGARRVRLRGRAGGERRRPPEGLPVHGGAPHRARAVCREATPVGREAAIPATDGAFRIIHEENQRAHIVCT